MGKNQHVTPHPKGGWQVKGAGNTRATVRTSTQKEAADIARSGGIPLSKLVEILTMFYKEEG